jgi:hypothetical protein
VSSDYLKRVPVSQLPVERVSRHLTLYDVNDLEAYFAQFRVAG